jgi:hypothetical protein
MDPLSLEEVLKIKSQVEGELLKQPGVTGVDVGYSGQADSPNQVLGIRVYVANQKAVPEAVANLKSIQGVPVEVIERRFDLH